MRDGEADLLGHVLRRHQRPFLVAGGASAALLAGEGHEHLMVAIAAADAGEAMLQIAALQEGRYRSLDDGPPEPVPTLERLSFEVI
jgi:hypothetical protein